jgi:hypothetical protein
VASPSRTSSTSCSRREAVRQHQRFGAALFRTIDQQGERAAASANGLI